MSLIISIVSMWRIRVADDFYLVHILVRDFHSGN
jgi:hypothetical protein